MAQVFRSLSPLLPPRYCSYCCNVCILVLTPTCSCEGSLYYNVLFPSKYISGMPKAMKRKRLLNKQNGFFLVFQKPLLVHFWVEWWVLLSVFYLSRAQIPPSPPPPRSPFNACHTGYVSSTSFGDGHHSQPQETTKKMFTFKWNS